MKEIAAVGALGIVLLLGILGIGWLIEGNDFLLYRYFAPKQEAVRRETYENTKSFISGSIQNLEKMQFEYLQAPKEVQPSLRSIILHDAANIDEAKLPLQLRAFIQNLKSQN